MLCLHMLIAAASLIRVLFIPQYSTKEDKYEEEIRVLTDKLKEVCMKIQDNCYSLSAINVLGYYRNLGSLRYGTSTASCKDAYGKMPFFS